MKGAGGTSGGIGTFLIGAAMLVVGGYAFLTQVTVTSNYWSFYGYNTFGLSLIPLLAGIAVLFFNGRSVLGWVLTAAGALIIVTGILLNLSVYFHPTSLYNTLIMLGLIAAGIGLVARSLRDYGSTSENSQSQ